MTTVHPKTKEVRLMANEKTLMVGPSVTSVTFMKGSLASAERQLIGKLSSILELNPWVGGSLSKRGSCIYLEYTEKPGNLSDSEVAALFNPHKKAGSPAPDLSASYSYTTICKVKASSSLPFFIAFFIFRKVKRA